MESNVTSDTPQSLVQGAARFFSGTLLSRIAGMLREMAMAFCFGTSPALALFFVAFRWANFFRRILGEGALLTGFIPLYTQVRAKGSRHAAIFLRDLFGGLFVFFFSFFSLLPLVAISFSHDVVRQQKKFSN